ncbi:MAG: hypothetical protein KKC18_10610 [Chloroflexi bacterium]|nr:hypothetical protein [Chloroflexota bacterium]
MDRWALFVDVEGFSSIYPENTVAALSRLRALMEGIYYIGNRVCPATPQRLFAHQLGDGFLVVSEFGERSPELPLAIGVFLLRCVLLAGGMGSCAIAQGESADIRGCYPDIVREHLDPSGTVALGKGIMWVFPVMGSALIDADRLSKRETGAVLLLDGALADRLPAGVVVTKRAAQHIVVDWIHTETPEMCEIETKTGITQPHGAALEERARRYLSEYGADLPRAWIENTRTLNQLWGGMMTVDDSISSEKTIRRAANWAIGMGMAKALVAVYLVSLPSLIGPELFSLIPIATIEILFTLAGGVAYFALGVKAKGDPRASRGSLLAVVVLSAVGMLFSLVTGSGGKLALDGLVFFMFWRALKAQKALVGR